MTDFSNPAILSQPSLPDYNGSTPASWSTASTGDVFETALQANLVDGLSNSQSVATQQAITQRNKAVKDATGQDLEDPSEDGYLPEALRRFQARTGASVPQPDMPGITASDLGLSAVDQRQVRDLQMQIYNEQLDELGKRYPQLPIGGDIQTAAKALANKSVADAQSTYQASGGGVLNALASFAGGAAASVRDPLQVAALTVGAGEATTFKSVAGQMLESFVRQGAVNAGVQAATEPGVAAWRASRGQAMSPSDMLEDVGMAALFGGGVGALVHGAGAALERVTRARELAGRAAEGDARAAEQLHASVPEGAAPELSAALRSVIDDSHAAEGARLPGFDDGLPPELAGPMLRDAARGMEDHDAPLMHAFPPGPWSTADERLQAAAKLLGIEQPIDVKAGTFGEQGRSVGQLWTKQEDGAPARFEMRVANPAALSEGELHGIMGHELGHAVDRSLLAGADPYERAGIEQDYQNAIESSKDQTIGQYLDRFTSPEVGNKRLTRASDRAKSMGEFQDLLPGPHRYFTSFKEWFADQVSGYFSGAPAPFEQSAAVRAFIENRLRDNWPENPREAAATARAEALPDASVRLLGSEEPPIARSLETARPPETAPAKAEGEGRPEAGEGLEPGDPLGQVPVVRDGAVALVDRADLAKADPRAEFMAGLIENCIL